jgi:integrase
MHVPRSERKPKFRLHAASGRAFVQLNGRRHYLGAHDDPQTKVRYQRLIGFWEANGRTLPPKPGSQFTITELCDVFEAWVSKRYQHAADGRSASEVDNFKRVMVPLRNLYGATPAGQFGPLALMVVREEFAKKRWCRRGVNRATERVRRIFKWAAGRQLLPVTIYNALQAIEPLRRGESELPEPRAVGPVPIEHVDAIQPHVSRQVWAIVQLQLRTAARAGEIVQMRAVDLDTSGAIWRYKPPHHKTEHHGKDRTIYLGPVAQDVVKPFLVERAIDAPLFSPAEAEAERLEELHRQRVENGTPLHHGNGRGKNRKANPKRTPGTMYRTAAYARAITRACKAAKVPHWHPHQLRHLATDLIEKEFGIEAARVMLGHSTIRMTAVYSSLDEAKAVDVVRRIG